MASLFLLLGLLPLAQGQVNAAAFVASHNSRRCRHGAPPVTWSNALAATAASWASTCSLQHSTSAFRNGAGENLYWGPSSSAEAALIGWYDNELPLFDFANPEASGSSLVAGHFTQVVWWNTNAIGCAVQSCAGRLQYSYMVVCHYSPAGNYIGQFAAQVKPKITSICGGGGGINWQVGADGNWAMGCDFKTKDLMSTKSTGDKCSTVCKTTKGCTHYTWTSFNGGTCWMKQGPVIQSDAISIADAGAVCGMNSAIAWKVNWANGCDFKGQDLKSSKTLNNGCGPACKATAGCTHFTWTTFNGGTCWMKQGPATKLNAFATGDNTMICGFP